MTIGVLGGGGFFVILAVIGVKIILMIIDRPVFADQMPVFWVLLSAVYTGTVALIPHYALYARRADKQIVTGALIVLPASIIGNYVLVPIYGITGSAMALLISNVILLILYLYFLFTFDETENPGHL